MSGVDQNQSLEPASQVTVEDYGHPVEAQPEAELKSKNVVSRTFCGIILSSLVLCGPGVLIDLDHWYANVSGVTNHRWLHYSLASTPLVLVLLSVCWGLITAAFALRWNAVK